MSQPIHQGEEGERVRVLQRGLNDRLRSHGEKALPVNGKCGPKVIEQSAFAAWFLGALMKTVNAVRGGTISVGGQAIIADPDSRDAAQRKRARERRRPFPPPIPVRPLSATAHGRAAARPPPPRPSQRARSRSSRAASGARLGLAARSFASVAPTRSSFITPMGITPTSTQTPPRASAK